MTIVVTGGAGGIGSAVCSCLVENRHTVISMDLEENADPRVHDVVGDLSLRDFAAMAFAEVAQEFGPLDGIVNSIGYYRSNSLADFSWEEFDRSIKINVEVPIEAALTFRRYRNEARRGTIVNIGSAGARFPSRDLAYAAAKAALEGATRSLAKSLAPENIAVFCISPGIVDSRMSQAMSAPRRSEQIESTWLKRSCTVEEVSDCVYFLLTGNTAYLTGSVIAMNGGLLHS